MKMKSSKPNPLDFDVYSWRFYRVWKKAPSSPKRTRCLWLAFL